MWDKIVFSVTVLAALWGMALAATIALPINIIVELVRKGWNMSYKNTDVTKALLAATCVALVIALSCQPKAVAWPTPTKDEEVVKEPTPQNRCVYVGTDKGHGSGVILRTNVIATTFHLFNSDSDTKVDGRMASVLSVHTKQDLTFLQAKTAEFPPLRWGTAEVGEEVYYIGNPLSHKCIQVFLRVVGEHNGKLYLDGTIVPGSSGSGVWNSKGELVAIVKARENVGVWNAFGYGIPASVVRKAAP